MRIIATDGEWHVARCEETRVVAQGRSAEAALAELDAALELHFDGGSQISTRGGLAPQAAVSAPQGAFLEAERLADGLVQGLGRAREDQLRTLARLMAFSHAIAVETEARTTAQLADVARQRAALMTALVAETSDGCSDEGRDEALSEALIRVRDSEESVAAASSELWRALRVAALEDDRLSSILGSPRWVLPASGEAVCAALKRAGFARAKQTGSHVKLRHPDGRTATVPMHRELRRGTLGSVLEQAGLSAEEFAAARG